MDYSEIFANPEETESLLGVPVLAHIPMISEEGLRLLFESLYAHGALIVAAAGNDSASATKQGKSPDKKSDFMRRLMSPAVVLSRGHRLSLWLLPQQRMPDVFGAAFRVEHPKDDAAIWGVRSEPQLENVLFPSGHPELALTVAVGTGRNNAGNRCAGPPDSVRRHCRAFSDIHLIDIAQRQREAARHGDHRFERAKPYLDPAVP